MMQEEPTRPRPLTVRHVFGRTRRQGENSVQLGVRQRRGAQLVQRAVFDEPQKPVRVMLVKFIGLPAIA